ncbi:MAG: cell wall metabolism sensor histidine kinase WalK [Clostridiales bacterium]|jgi:two-component system sensor histidine kinase VicK|nr:cell wall metabolism sensor histidine kinase WalK [Clostridiales bacterium]
MRSIKTKLIAIYAAVVLVVMTVSGTFMLLTVRNMEIEQTHNALRSHAELINERIVQVYDKDTYWDAQEWMMLGQSDYDIEGILLFSESGRPIAPRQFVFAEMSFNDRSLAGAMTGNESFNVGSLGVDLSGAEHQWFTFAMPVSSGDGNYIIYTRMKMRSLNERLSSLTLTLITMVLIALVITIVFWFFLGSTLTNSIVALTRHAKAIASGDFSREVKISSNDEIGQLAKDFKYMSQELRATLSRMASEKNKSEAFLKNTSHGVLAYDASGQLLHANNSSSELLHGMYLNNTDFNHTLKFFGFDPDDIKKLQPGKIRESVHEDEDFYLYACITTYTNESGEVDGYVIILQDITRQQKLDNMRKEFVANVSHELRTPLTNIKTYSETLLDGAIDDRETAIRFLKVIDDESERMSLLVSDLLELSRIDSKQVAPEIDVVDLVALLRLAIRQAQIPAEQKSQKIEFVSPQNACFIEANAARINQVVSNILSNSIKYSPENTKIRITTETTEKFYRVFIKDQGMGIPQESLSRIFERFYRVDKARSRSLGGTGLGLAIVKEIMEEHGGSVQASSKPGQGTTMVLRFNRMAEMP